MLFKSANSTSMAILGSIKAKIQISSNLIDADMLVAKDLTRDCLLGRDLISKCPELAIHMESLKNTVTTLSVELGSESKISEIQDSNTSIELIREQIMDLLKNISVSNLTELRRMANSKPIMEHSISILDPENPPTREKMRRVHILKEMSVRK